MPTLSYGCVTTAEEK